MLKHFLPHQSTHRLENLNHLGENQWGSRPLRSVETVAVFDEIFNGIHRITCKPMIKHQNDATACYVRMICNLTTLYSHSYNAPEKSQLHTKSLNNM